MCKPLVIRGCDANSLPLSVVMVFTVFRYGMSNLTTVLAIVDVTSVDMVAGHEDMSVTKRYEVPSRHL